MAALRPQHGVENMKSEKALAVLAPTQAQFTACTTLGNYTDDIYREVPIKNARTSVTISSPNFPQPYPQNIQCTWRVLAPPGYQVKLSFLTFELEQSYLRSGCHDYVSVSQGGGQFIEAKEMTRQCDSTKPRDVRSDGEILWVRFITDTEIEKKGFTIKVIPESGSSSKRYIVLGILITAFVLIILAIIWCRKRFHRKQKDDETHQIRHHYQELCILSEPDRDAQTDRLNNDPEEHEEVPEIPEMRSPTRDTSSAVVLHLRALKSSEASGYCSLSEDGRSFENHRLSGKTTQKKPNEEDHMECTELLTVV